MRERDTYTEIRRKSGSAVEARAGKGRWGSLARRLRCRWAAACMRRTTSTKLTKKKEKEIVTVTKTNANGRPCGAQTPAMSSTDARGRMRDQRVGRDNERNVIFVTRKNGFIIQTVKDSYKKKQMTAGERTMGTAQGCSFAHGRSRAFDTDLLPLYGSWLKNIMFLLMTDRSLITDQMR